jgi:hypothetical protein
MRKNMVLVSLFFYFKSFFFFWNVFNLKGKCYSLDLECTLRGHVLKDWSQSDAGGGCRALKMWGLVGGLQVVGGECP